MKIKVNRFGDFEPLPKRAHYNDAGADVTVSRTIFIPHGQTRRIPLGFGLEIPDGYVGFVFPRSGKASKGLVCELPPIDSGYRGEVHAIVSNMSSEGVTVKRGEKIGQLVIMPVVLAEFVEDLGDERGAGAFGSTGE